MTTARKKAEEYAKSLYGEDKPAQIACCGIDFLAGWNAAIEAAIEKCVDVGELQHEFIAKRGASRCKGAIEFLKEPE